MMIRAYLVTFLPCGVPEQIDDVNKGCWEGVAYIRYHISNLTVVWSSSCTVCVKKAAGAG